MTSLSLLAGRTVRFHFVSVIISHTENYGFRPEKSFVTENMTILSLLASNENNPIGTKFILNISTPQLIKFI